MKFTAYFITFIFCSIYFTSIAQINTWTGNAGDSNWHNATNWDLNSVPITTDNVVIPENLSVVISVEGALAYSILLNPNASLTIEQNLAITQLLTITPESSLIWNEGELSSGLIENDGDIHLESLETKDLHNTTLINRNNIFITNSNIIRFFGNTTINNEVTGQIVINSNGGIIEQAGGVATINNSGLLKKISSGSFGTFYMVYDMNNYGILEIGEDQTFLFLVSSQNFNNQGDGTLQGNGTFDITANFTNTGIVSPGGENDTGELDIVNNFSLDLASRLIINIDGIATEEFDKVSIFGSPDLDGTIEVRLNYEPNIDDEFPIINANLGITSCNFPSQVIATYNDFDFTFDVICNANSVVLKVQNITLGFDDLNDDSKNFQVVPNPIEDSSHFIFPVDLITNNTSISIYNLLGQEIKSLKTSNEIMYLRDFNLASGLFVAQLKYKDGVLASTKFIIP